MERKELFSAARDEHGDLALYFPESGWAIAPEKKFWQEMINRIERSLKGENADLFGPEDRLPVEEAGKIIRKCLENW